MEMDFEQVFRDMLAAARDRLDARGPQARNYLREVMEQQKDVLARLARDRVSGALSDEDLRMELEAVRADVTVALEGLEVIARETAESAWNAAVKVLLEALTAAI
ncbi:MAG TPA: hypothetical protein VFA86_05190 [Gammaproteobacteria bacterium]|nr:hypothetical protein [Gammaproteobacteria bacterium]